MKAQGFYVEGTEIKIPSHVTLVEGIDTYVGASIDGHINTIPPISDLDPEVLPQPD